jgi:hypothetical protein
VTDRYAPSTIPRKSIGGKTNPRLLFSKFEINFTVKLFSYTAVFPGTVHLPAPFAGAGTGSRRILIECLPRCARLELGLPVAYHVPNAMRLDH